MAHPRVDAIVEQARAAVAAAQSRVAASRGRGQTARANVAEIQQQVERTKKLVAQNAAPRSTEEDLTARVKALEVAALAADADADGFEVA